MNQAVKPWYIKFYGINFLRYAMKSNNNIINTKEYQLVTGTICGVGAGTPLHVTVTRTVAVDSITGGALLIE
jgi:hypothetical protein